MTKLNSSKNGQRSVNGTGTRSKRSAFTRWKRFAMTICTSLATNPSLTKSRLTLYLRSSVINLTSSSRSQLANTSSARRASLWTTCLMTRMLNRCRTLTKTIFKIKTRSSMRIRELRLLFTKSSAKRFSNIKEIKISTLSRPNLRTQIATSRSIWVSFQLEIPWKFANSSSKLNKH